MNLLGKKKDREEKSKAQLPPMTGRVVANTGMNDSQKNLLPPPPANIATWREMRLDPTLALARAIANAPIRTANVSVVPTSEDTPPEHVEMIDDFVKKNWSSFITNSLYARDYGFQPFEIIYTEDKGMISIDSLKALLPDITQVILDKHGDYVGLINGAAHTEGGDVERMKEKDGVTVLSPTKSVWIVNGREGDNYYGESAMERARKAWHEYNEIRKKGTAYATSIAGPIPYVTYPDAEVEDESGQKRPAYEMAATLIRSLQNAQGVAVPSYNAAWLDRQLDAMATQGMPQAWEIGFFETANHGSEFLEFEKARDVEKFRAWLVPERAGMEGQYGTKAEAEVHGSLVLTIADLFIQDVVQVANKELVNTLLMVNYGEDAVDGVKIVVESKDPAQLLILQDLVRGLFGSPINIDLFENLANLKSIFEILGIPLLEADETDGEEDEPTMDPVEEPDDPAEEEELAIDGERYIDDDGAIYEYSDGHYNLILDAGE